MALGLIAGQADRLSSDLLNPSQIWNISVLVINNKFVLLMAGNITRLFLVTGSVPNHRMVGSGWAWLQGGLSNTGFMSRHSSMTQTVVGGDNAH